MPVHARGKLGTDGAPVVAVSDWMRALPDLIRQWVPAPFTTLGTDGFGLSDTRPATRRHFNVDAESITVAALETLAAGGRVRPRRGGRGRGEVPHRRPAGRRSADQRPRRRLTEPRARDAPRENEYMVD